MTPVLSRRAQVKQRYGVSRTWIYDTMKRGDCPRPVSLGSKCVRWRVADLKEWEASRPAADSDEAKVGRKAVKGARLMAMPTAGGFEHIPITY